MAIRFSKLTKAAIKNLEPGKTLNEHSITATKLRSGDVRWSVGLMVDRRRIHRTIGTESAGITREQCVDAIAAFKTKAREDRLDLPSGRKTYRSFAEAADEYIMRIESEGGKNLKPKRQHLRMHLKPALGRERLDKITEPHLHRYRRCRSDAGASAATINREMATLSHMLRRAVAWKWIKPEAVPIVPKAQENRGSITILNESQSDALMNGAIADQDSRLWLFVAFGLGTAMRHREILKTRYDQIDFDNRRIFIPTAKAGEREQPITKALCDLLFRQRRFEADSDGWVFPTLIASQAKSGHRTNMARPFQRAVIRAGLDPDRVTPHTMRHSAITRLVKAGVDLPTIQRISGHKTLAMVLRYTHVHGSHIDAAIATLDRAIPSRVTQELH